MKRWSLRARTGVSWLVRATSRDRGSSPTRLAIVSSHHTSVWRVVVADSWRMRAVGLLGDAPPNAGELLWLRPCRVVHTFGMRFAIDAALLDHRGEILALRTLAPGTVFGALRARSVIEARAGEWRRAGLAVGQRLSSRACVEDPTR